MNDVIEIDGAAGEGGGQVLRTSLGLAAVIGRPVRITNVRGARKKGGLLRQHLTGLRAVAEVTGGDVRGDELRSKEVEFRPGRVRAGSYHFAVGTAGSAALVLQTVLPALLRADGPSEVILEGGTDNPASPAFDFLRRTFAPLVARAGAELTLTLERRGYYPAGGGRFVARVTPAADGLQGFALLERGARRSRSAIARVSQLPRKIGHRELRELHEPLELDRDTSILEEVDSMGPGNTVHIVAEHEHITHVVTGFGEKRVRAEEVARRALTEYALWDAFDVPVGEHLADQLVLLLALAGGGRFRMVPPMRSKHFETQVALIPRFLPVSIDTHTEEGGAIEVVVAGR